MISAKSLRSRFCLRAMSPEPHMNPAACALSRAVPHNGRCPFPKALRVVSSGHPQTGSPEVAVTGIDVQGDRRSMSCVSEVLCVGYGSLVVPWLCYSLPPSCTESSLLTNMWQSLHYSACHNNQSCPQAMPPSSVSLRSRLNSGVSCDSFIPHSDSPVDTGWAG